MKRKAVAGGDERDGGATANAAGKRTLSERLTVQRQVSPASALIAPAVAAPTSSAPAERAGLDDPFGLHLGPGAGAGLPVPLQARLQSSLGADLSAVRVHTGGESAAAAEGLGAHAFTVGQDIHFAAGQYAPGSKAGDELIAHEAAHTVQQQGATAPAPARASVEVTTPGDDSEREASAFASAFADPAREAAAPQVKPRGTAALAGWWASGHREITVAVGRQKDTTAGGPFHPAVVDYLGEMAGAQDLTVQSITNFAWHLGINSSNKDRAKFEKQIGKTRDKRLKDAPNLDQQPQEEAPEHTDEIADESLRKNKEQWDSLAFHHRQTSEMPLHGEGGGYRILGGGTQNAAAVTRQINEAARLYASGDHREGLLKLSDAIHSAEDRGSHGEGDPFTGHDPRLTMEFKWDGTPNEHYVPGWDCDNPGINAGGRDRAEGFAAQAYDDFWKAVRGDDGAVDALRDGKGGKGQTGVKTALKHGFRALAGLPQGPVKKGDDVLTQLTDQVAYETKKQENPAAKFTAS